MSQEAAYERLATAPAEIEIAPMTLHIGAVIGGVDLTAPLTAQAVKEIRAALLKWKVIFFRDQHLDHDQHRAFARRFGEPTVGHTAFGHIDGYPEIYSVDTRRKANNVGTGEKPGRPWTGWHADVTTAINPPAASILRGVTVPHYGGDTRWTNLAAAYNGLSETLRGFVDGLRGVHRFCRPRKTPRQRTRP